MAEVTGLRVLRGPDWNSGDGDGGEGYLGTVLQSLGDHEVRVLWDMGQESTCRTGKGGKFDLRVFDTGPVGIRHVGTRCAECGEQDVPGALWRCQLCPSCHLCSLCYSDDHHDTRHHFLRIDTPNAPGQPLPKRTTSVKIRTIGLHPGAKVVRGRDWEWGDQDGGQESEGEVQGHDDTSEAPRSHLLVRWSNGSTHSYRLGMGGKVDVTCVEEEVGPFYYRDHLPLLDTTDTSTTIVKETGKTSTSKTTTDADASKQSVNGQHVIRPCTTENMTPFSAALTPAQEQPAGLARAAEDEEPSEGDRVAIKVDEDQLLELQKDCGGCTARMLRCIGRTGEVTTISKGLVSVKFQGSAAKISYRFNPKALLKVAASFSENDVVRIRDDVKLLEVLNRRVGWNSAMDKTASRVGRVVEVDEEGDLRVEFRDGRHVFAPACCLPVVGGGLDRLPSVAEDTGGDTVSFNHTPRRVHREENYLSTVSRPLHDLIQVEGRRGHGRSARSLFAAIEYNDVDRVRSMCERDPSMVEGEHKHITPLIYASLRGRESCAKVLLALGADVNRAASDDYRKTPLSAVAEGKSEAMAELLLSRGAATDRLYGEGHTLAHLCALRNKPLITQLLVTHGADLNIRDDEDYTALHLAIRLRRHHVMEVLVGASALNTRLCIGHDWDFLQFAAFWNNARAMERLLARDSSQVDRRREGHSTALHIAATNDHVDCVRVLLLQGGADINARQPPAEETSLMIACHRAKLRTVEALLELGADVNVCDRDGDTALHLAIGGQVEGKGERGVAYRVQIANLLISKGAYADAENLAGLNPFSRGSGAVRRGVQAFIKHNREVVHLKRREADRVLQRLGVSGLDNPGPGQLREALVGVPLPCALCGAPRADLAFTPCGHRCACRACGVKVTRCPLCDEGVEGKVACSD